MREKSFRFEIFLISLAAILLEISYTRVFSFKLFYYFTYLTIGIALLGLGSGGVLIATIPQLRRMASQRLVAACCIGGAAVIPIGYVVVARVQLNALDIVHSVAELAKLLLISTAVFTPFLLVGIILAAIFGARPKDISRLYFADLAGAGLGCALSIPLFYLIGPPGCVMLSAFAFALAALYLARGTSQLVFWSALALAIAALGGALATERLPDPVVDQAKSMSRQRGGDGETLFSRWGTVFRVDVVPGWDAKNRHSINHDGNLGSVLVRFDGDLSALDRFKRDVRSEPFSVIGDAPEVLIIGAAGGHEILASLYFGAKKITAVELNPVTVSLLTTHFADFTGHIADHERVTLITGEGRSFISNDTKQYDLIWFVAPDSYAAMNAASSGGFVLSESYLYTKETIVESLSRLKPGGVVCLQVGEVDFERKPNRALRYLATARAAFEELGIEEFHRHVLLSATPDMFTVVTTILSRDPFTDEQVESFFRNATAVAPSGATSTVWHPRPEEPTGAHHLVTKPIVLPRGELEDWRQHYPYQISPVSDDAPFFWHFTGFYDAVVGLFRTPRALANMGLSESPFDQEDAKGERVLVALFLFAVAFSAVCLLVPLMALRDLWRQIPYKLHTGTYFAGLGLGFMFFEIVMIQKLTLFLGYPTYSLTVTLFALLMSSGVGSLLSARYSASRNRALFVLVGSLALLSIGYVLGMDPLLHSLRWMTLWERIALAVLVLLPLGLCLGAFMPIGIATVADLTPLGEAYVAWGWAVNGFFSVISSILATILAMTFGFTVVLVLAMGTYVIGAASLARVPR